MSDSAALTKTTPPRARFEDHIHAMTAQSACAMAITGLEHLLSNLRRMSVPVEFEAGHAETMAELESTLHGVRNLRDVFAGLVAAQQQEGTL